MVSLIVVDYRTIGKTCDFLSQARQFLAPWDQVHCWIVDNDPEKSGRAYLSERYPLIRSETDPVRVDFFGFEGGEAGYIAAGENLGYARGNNLGIRTAKALCGDPFFLVCNNDLRFCEPWDLTDFWKRFEQYPRAAVLGPKITGLDGREQNPYRKRSPLYWLFVYPWSRFGPVHSRGDYVFTSKAGEYYRLMGSCMLIRGDCFEACGGVDEKTFLFSEEMILSERLAGKGYTCRYEPGFRVIHEHGRTVKSLAKEVQVERWFLDALFHYCRAYRGTSGLTMALAWVNRELNLGVVALKAGIRKLLRMRRS